MCLMALSMQSQRCAVLEFKAGVGISQNDVDGISALFITYFQPDGFTMVERTQIDRVIDEQGFQRSSMTQDQIVRLGEILNVSKIVIGEINIVFEQYQVDARIVNVETGTIAATEGATFTTTSYRNSMQDLAVKLASKIAITPNAEQTNTNQQQTEPYIIYGYLKVFPTDLGTFDTEPKAVIAQLNKSIQYGYGTWRLPTNEELDLMRANKTIDSGTYMTKETKTKRGIVRLVTDREKGETTPAVPQGYVDLGLPSGTLWKDQNETGLYTYYEAIAKFGNELPTKEKLYELIDSCQWTWNGSGYKVTGPNGKSITLPAAGIRYVGCSVAYKGSKGNYWSSTPNGEVYAWALYFDYREVIMSDTEGQAVERSVRLVQDRF